MHELLAHLCGDYLVQTDWMATEKTRRSLPAAVHAATYGACFLPITRNPRALLVIAGTHYLIDRYRLARHLAWAKNQLAPRRYRYPLASTTTGYGPDKYEWLAFWLMIVTDNTLHVAINHMALRRRGDRGGRTTTG